MRLNAYLKRENLSITAFAARINRNPSSVSRVLRGLTRPDWDTLREIARVTDGEVMPDDFLDSSKTTSPGGPRAAPDRENAA